MIKKVYIYIKNLNFKYFYKIREMNILKRFNKKHEKENRDNKKRRKHRKN